MSFDLLRRRPPERSDVLLRHHHRIGELIVLVIELDDRSAEAACPPRCRGGWDSVPAATLRTTTSSGMISTSRINCSRMLRRLMKCVGTPDVVQVLKDISEIRFVEDALAFDDLMLSFALKAVASSLKCWISVPGSGPS